MGTTVTVQLFTPGNVLLNGAFENKEAVFDAIAKHAVKLGVGRDGDLIAQELASREAMASTCVGKGVAVPHCKSSAISDSALLVLRPREPVIWDEAEGISAGIIFAILTNEDSADHLALLAKLARHIMHEDFLEAITSAIDEQAIYRIVSNVIGGID